LSYRLSVTCDGLECQVGSRQCGEDGDSCQVAGDCCSGTCDGGVCGGDDDPDGRCGENGDSCQDDFDCCSDVCDGGVCGQDDGGRCGEIFDSCQIDLDCCSGLQVRTAWAYLLPCYLEYALLSYQKTVLILESLWLKCGLVFFIFHSYMHSFLSLFFFSV
jgi:hypothetical protein